LVDPANLDPGTIKHGVAGLKWRASELTIYRKALAMVKVGEAHAACFTPFNKQAVRFAH